MNTGMFLSYRSLELLITRALTSFYFVVIMLLVCKLLLNYYFIFNARSYTQKVKSYTKIHVSIKIIY